MKSLIALLPLIFSLTSSAQTKTTVDSLRHTVTVAKKLRDGSVDVRLYEWQDQGMSDRLDFLMREFFQTRTRLDSLINEIRGYYGPPLDSAGLRSLIQADNGGLYYWGRNKGAVIQTTTIGRTSEEMLSQEKYDAWFLKVVSAISTYEQFPAPRRDTTHQRIHLTTK